MGREPVSKGLREWRTGGRGGRGSGREATRWEESASFREQARDAVREAGRVLYDLTIEASRGIEERGSATRAELRAGQADLHYLGGWFEAIRQQEQQSSLTEDDMALARFAGQVAAQLANLEAEIERRLA